MKNVIWRVDVGCSGPGKAGANRPKVRGADHLAVCSFENERRCFPVELDAMRVARPVRGRLSRVIPSVVGVPTIEHCSMKFDSPGRSNT